MLGIADYFWRLIPANPILLRVVQMNGKRRRDLFIRCGYLGLLIGVVIFSLMSGNTSSGNLSELAKTSASLFQYLSYWQLGLVALLAPIFTAGAITQEKDSQTYDILLATPLTNGQIVLGSLLSRLFFVVALLISGIPIFSITQIFGGVAIGAIVRSFGIAAATAFVTGAMAMAIAVFKVGTRRTIFNFYFFIVLYIVGLWFLDQVSYFKIQTVSPITGLPELSKTSWLTGLHPFLALQTIFHDKDHLPPAIGDLPKEWQGWPWGWYLSNPASFYTTFMFFLSFVLISPSILLLRRLAQSTTSPRVWLMQKLRIGRGDRTRKPRFVWANPIAWREAKTKASAARASLVRYGFIGLGLLGALVLVWLYSTDAPAPFPTYIEPNSWNLLPTGEQSLTVYSTEGAATTLLLESGASATTFMLDGKPEENQANLHDHFIVNATMKKDASNRPVAWQSISAITPTRRLKEGDARTTLFAITVIEFSIILLIVTNAAASTVTREKEDGTLDLLLSTPITSRYYIWGKLRGLVSFVLPLIAVPVLSVFFFILFDFMHLIHHWNATGFRWIVFPEAVLILPGMLVVVVAFASILGMQMSLRCRKTVVAVMSSIGIIGGVCAALGWCGYQMLESKGSMGPVGWVVGSFSPFTLLQMLINPFGSNDSSDDMVAARWFIFIFTWIAVAAYTGVVWTMYKSMVKNFDMTIRKQSR